MDDEVFDIFFLVPELRVFGFVSSDEEIIVIGVEIVLFYGFIRIKFLPKTHLKMMVSLFPYT
jgi:hypothetical protein